MPLFPMTDRKRLLLALTSITVVGLLLYLHTLHARWYLDDWKAIVNHKTLRDLGQAGKILLAPRGLANWTFALNIAFGGFSLPGFHLVNIAIHIASGWLVLLLLDRAFSRSVWLPLIGALLFVAHPLQTEAVTYIVQRMTSLSTLLTLLALYLGSRAWELRADGLRFAAPRHLVWYVGALLCGLGALLSKEIAAMLPALFWIYARAFLPRFEGGWRAELAYLAPLAVAPLVMAAWILLPQFNGNHSLAEVGHAQILSEMAGNDPPHYLATQFSVIWIYLRLLVLPFGQALDYGYPISQELVTFRSAAGLLGILGLLGLAWRLRSVRPALSCGILWFFLALAPESSFIPLDALFEHRLYLPMFGFVLVFCSLLEMIPRTSWMLVTACALLLGLGLLTWQRNQLWNNQIALMEDNLRRTPNNERVCHNLALLYGLADRQQERETMLVRALQIRPGYVVAADTLSRLYLEEGRKDEGLQVLERAIQANPRSGLLHTYLARYKKELGEARGIDEDLRIAAQLDSRLPARETLLLQILYRLPGDVQASDLLARSYFDLGRREEGRKVLENAIEVNPRRALLYLYLANYKDLCGEGESAEEELKTALALEPEGFETNLEMGRFLARRGTLAEAEGYLRKAIAIKTGSAAAHADLATLLEMQGRSAEAAELSATAIRLRGQGAQ